jgi:RsiG-like
VTDDSFVERLRLEPLAGLRALRMALREQERQVSYWRRLVQGRLDLAEAALAGDQPSVEKLTATASGQRPDPRRSGAPPRSPSFAKFVNGIQDRRLASLAAAWDTPIPWDDRERLREVEATLVEIERELSKRRRDLHERIDACTAELVNRYRRDPEELKRLGPTPR